MRRFLTAFFLGSVCASSFSQNGLQIKGHFQGANLYVQNPEHATDTNSFCVDSVYLNGKRVEFLKASAFEIDLKAMGLLPGDSIELMLYHSPGCKPKILNPNVTRHGVFEIVSIEVKNDSVLTWTTKTESQKQIFYVEQYIWNKWITVGEVEGSGSATGYTYDFGITLHSGHNQFRVKQLQMSSFWDVSPEARYLNNKRALTILEIDNHKRTITLSGDSRYELYDAAGNMVKKGFGAIIDCSDLPRGTYYLNYDNSTEVIHFKKVKAPKDVEDLPLH